MKIAVICPVYGDYPQGFAGSLINLMQKINISIISPNGSSNVTSVRNSCFQQVFVEEEVKGRFDKLLFIDSDIIFSIEDVEKLIAHNKEVVSGVYFKKSPPYEPVAGYYDVNRIKNGFPTITKPQMLSKQLVEVDWVGMGFVMMDRTILNKMEYPWFDMRVIDLPKPTIMGGNIVIKKEILSEDISFWTKVRELGYKIWLDTAITVKHIGRTNYTLDHYLAMSGV